jgi:hypothetical protein
MVRSPWLCPMLKGPPLRKGARLEGPSGRPTAARSAARLPEDAAGGAPRGARVPKGTRHLNERQRLAARHTLNFMGAQEKTGDPGASTNNTGDESCAHSYPPVTGEG